MISTLSWGSRRRCAGARLTTLMAVALAAMIAVTAPARADALGSFSLTPPSDWKPEPELAKQLADQPGIRASRAYLSDRWEMLIVVSADLPAASSGLVLADLSSTLRQFVAGIAAHAPVTETTSSGTSTTMTVAFRGTQDGANLEGLCLGWAGPAWNRTLCGLCITPDGAGDACRQSLASIRVDTSEADRLLLVSTRGAASGVAPPSIPYLIGRAIGMLVVPGAGLGLLLYFLLRKR